MFKIKIIPEIDKNQKILDFAQTPIGKLSIWLIFSFIFWLLHFHNNGYLNLNQGLIWDKIIIFGLFILFPHFKKHLLVMASLYWLCFHHFQRWPLPFLQKVANLTADNNFVWYSICFSIMLILILTPTLKKLPYKNISLLFIFNLALVLVGPSSLPFWVGGSLIILSQYLWYWLFAIKDENFKWWHLLTFMPFWTWTILPIPKAWHYLSQTETQTSYDKTLCELKALKLISWTLFLAFMQLLLQTFIYGQRSMLQEVFQLNVTALALPLNVTLNLYHANSTLSILTCWSSVFWNFIDSLLFLTVGTHAIVAVVRLCGWNVKRNVYRCLEAKSISEFFNRYYYYFKELLVEIFFYPSYFTFFKKHSTLRLFFATLMAAGLGNFLFHFNVEANKVFELGFWNALSNFKIYALYCFILALGIFISQWSRMHQKFQSNIWITRLRILLFFMLLNTFLEPGGTLSLKEHFSFLLHLFSL